MSTAQESQTTDSTSGENREPERKHTQLEDIIALAIAVFFCSLGLMILKHHGLITGGIAGLGLLLHQLTGYSFGLMFFLANLPFYAFGWKYLGWVFLLRTFITVGCLSLATNHLPSLISFDFINPVFAALGGGLMIGMSLLIVFRHGASLGGAGILAVWLHKRYGVNTGVFQLVVDLSILLACMATNTFQVFLLSILSIVAMSVVIGLNHKPGRYHIRLPEKPEKIEK